MAIHTPRLCDDPAFRVKTTSAVHPINCNPIVSDAKYEKMSKERSLDGPSERTAGTDSNDKPAIATDGSVKEEAASNENAQSVPDDDARLKIAREIIQDEETLKLILMNEEINDKQLDVADILKTVIQSLFTEDNQKHHSTADLTHQAKLSEDYEVVYELFDEKNNEKGNN